MLSTKIRQIRQVPLFAYRMRDIADLDRKFWIRSNVRLFAARKVARTKLRADARATSENSYIPLCVKRE